jgi:hypothetical protein
MRHFILAFWILSVVASSCFAQPRVVVLPFDPIMDSLYSPYGGKESILNYRPALQEMLTADLVKHTEIRVLEPFALRDYIKNEKVNPDYWDDPVLASKLATGLGADYAIIGTYGEFAHEIRVDARVALAASTAIPQGYSVTASAKLWDNLPTAAGRISEELIAILTSAGNLHSVSTAILYPEGDLSAYDPGGTIQGMARLVIWVNAPSPEIKAGSAQVSRCERIDLTGASTEKQRTHACRVAVLPAGSNSITISHRGFLPFTQSFTFAAGKAYRLEVTLQPVEVIAR